MAKKSTGTPTLRQFDICMPFEFIKKCAQLSCVESGISWLGAVRGATDGQLHQNYKNSKVENTGFEEWRLDSLSENVQIAHIKTCINPENMLLISFSKVHLEVLEGRCGFLLSNVQKDDSVAVYPAVVSNKCSSEVESTSKLTGPSAITPMVDYVEIENNSKTFDDLKRSDKILDSLSINSNISDRCYSTCIDSIISDDLSKKNIAESVTEKQACLEEISSNPIISLNPFNFCDSIASPLKENLDENLLGDKHLKKLNFPSEINTVHKQQELAPSSLVLCQEKNSNDLSGETSQDNGKLLPSPAISLTQESEVKAIKKKTYNYKPKKQFSQQNKNLCPQVVEKMTKVNDTSVIPHKKYMLRGVKVPKYLIEEEKNSRHLVPKNNCKNQNIESSLCNKEFHLTNDKPALLSNPENSVSPPLLLSVSKKEQGELGDVDSNKPKRRKRNNTRVVECRYCKKMFCDYTGVDEHVKKFHTNEADFLDYIAELKKLKVVICNKCNMTLQNRYLLQEHENNVHSIVNSEVCSVCGKNYKNFKSLRNHMKFVHATDKAYLCHFCPAKFKWTGTLKQHIQNVHEGIRKFSCPTCSKEFFCKSQLNRHIRIHGSDESKRITCTLCNKGFWFENNYLRHMKTIHQPQLEEFHCSYCGKGFSQKARMVAHVQLVHLKIYTYSCKICKMGFTRSKSLQVHMAQVHNETDFVVPDKQKGHFKFNQSAADLLYCHYCNQSFYYKAQVVEHIHKEHTFPYQCDKCKQGFVLKKFLDNHLRQAHGVEVEVSIENEDENNDTEEVLKHLLELKSVSAVSPKCISDNITPLENSEGVPGMALLSPPDTDSHENLLSIQNTDNCGTSTSATSLLLEVAKDSGTVHYFIQQGHRNDKKNQMDNNQPVFEDIASLLLVAEEASNKQSLPVISGQAEAKLVNEVESKNVEAMTSPTVKGDTWFYWIY